MRVLIGFCFLAFCLLPCSIPVMAQTLPADSLGADTLSYPGRDTMRTRLHPIQLVGSVDRTFDSPPYVLSDSILPFREYRGFTDAMRMLPGLFARELGSPGQEIGLALQGIEGQSIVVMQDGVIRNDPMTGMGNPDLLPTENIGRVEIISGPRAFLFGLNSTGGVINLVSKQRRSLHAESHIRYSESANGFGIFDGMVSQDIFRGFNVTAGLHHPTFTGIFRNTAFDAWAPRLSARYDISGSASLFASGSSFESTTGLNGGINPATPDTVRFDGLLALVQSDSAYEKRTLRDVRLGGAFRLPGDSSGITTMTGSASTQLREFRTGLDRGAKRILTEQDHRTQQLGLRIIHERPLFGQPGQLGFEIEQQAVIASDLVTPERQTTVAMFGLVTLTPLPFVTLTTYARMQHSLGQSVSGAGGDLAYQISDQLTFTAGASRSYRFPSFAERAWGSGGVDTLFTSPQGLNAPERHELFQTGLRYSSEHSSGIELLYFHRTIRDAYAIVSTNGNPAADYTVTQVPEELREGMTLSLHTSFGPFLLETSGQYLFMQSPVRSPFLPRWSCAGGFYYWNRLIDNHLHLKTGFEGRYFSEYDGAGFDQKDLLYIPGGQKGIRSAGVLDFVLIAHLGDAYVHFIWHNLLDRNYLTTVFYPMPGRAIRFGIGWAFLD